MTSYISKLRLELEDLISEHLPQVWENGDIRYLNRCLYYQIVDKYRTIEENSDTSDFKVKAAPGFECNGFLFYLGHFGLIQLRPAE